MDRIALLLIGLVFGAGVGFVAAAGLGVTFDGHDHGAHGGHGGAEAAAHEHGAPLDLAAGPDAPDLAIELAPDPVAGWNLRLEAGNFRFAPEKAGAAHEPGEGHAHLYIDGEKIARLYGPWAHIPALAPGAEVMVTLNANDHRALKVDGAPIVARATTP